MMAQQRKTRIVWTLLVSALVMLTMVNVGLACPCSCNPGGSCVGPPTWNCCCCNAKGSICKRCNPDTHECRTNNCGCHVYKLDPSAVCKAIS